MSPVLKSGATMSLCLPKNCVSCCIMLVGLLLGCLAQGVTAQPPVSAVPVTGSNSRQLPEDAEDFGKDAREIPFQPMMFYAAAVSPDQAWAAVGTNDWKRPGEVIVFARGGTDEKPVPVRRLSRGFRLGVRTVAFSPDNRWLAAGSFTNEVWLLDLKNFRQAAFWSAHTGTVNDLVFSPDSQRLATASYDKTIGLWDVTPPETANAGLPLRARFEGHTEPVDTVTFSPDGRSILSGARDMRVKIWDLETKALKSSWESPAQVEHIAVSPDGEAVACALWNGNVEVRARETGAVLQKLTHLDKPAWTVGRVAFSPSGDQLASVATDGQLKLWNWKNGSLNKTVSAHPGHCWAVQFISDDTKLMTAGMEGIVKFWDLPTERELFQIRPHDGVPETSVPIIAAAWSPAGAALATSHADRSFRMRRGYSGISWGEVRELPQALTLLALSPKNDQAVGAGDGPQLYLFETSPDSFKREASRPSVTMDKRQQQYDTITLTGHTKKVRGLAYAADGATLFSVSEDGTVRHWDAATGLPGPTRSPQQGPLHSVACSPDGHWLAAAGQSGKILVWDLHTANLQPAATLAWQAGAILALAFSARNQLACSSDDKSLRLWTLIVGTDGKLSAPAPKELTGQIQPLARLAFSPVGGWLVGDGPEKITRLWHTDSGTPGPQFPTTSHPLLLGFSPDGMRLLRVGDDGPGQYWVGSPPTIKPIAQLDLADGVRFIAFTPDQQQALIGTLTATVHAWDMQTGKMTKTHINEGIADGALSADGKTLVTLGFSGDVSLWTPTPLKVVATIKRPADIKTVENEGTTIAVSRDGARLGTGSWDGTVILWDVPARKELGRLPKQELPIAGIRFSPDGTLLATATGSWKEWQKPGTVKLWRVDSQKEFASLQGPRSQIRRVVFSRDGVTLLAGGSQNELLRSSSSADGQWLQTQLLPLFGDCSAMDFLGDSRDAAVVGTSEGNVSVWRFDDRSRRDAMGHHAAKAVPVSAVASSPDGSLFATGTSSGEVHFYAVPNAAPTSLATQLAARKLPGEIPVKKPQP